MVMFSMNKKTNFKFIIGLIVGFGITLTFVYMGLNMPLGNQVAVIRVSGVISSSPTIFAMALTAPKLPAAKAARE